MPAVGYSLIKDGDTRQPTNQVVYHGLQPSGRYLNKIDLDSHNANQDADAAKAAFEQQFPSLNKVDWRPSDGNHGRPGWHGYVLSNKPLPHGKIYDQNGQHIGELLSSDDSFSILPDNLQPGWLSPTEYDLICRFWTFQGATQSGDKWRTKATEGARLASGYIRHRITRAQLRTFLRTHCGEPGKDLDALFDSRKLFNRSDAAGNLMQCLMFHIHKLLPMGGYSERCALAMAYWMAADSYGKSDNYDQETDGYALIEKIVNERPREGGGRWRAPFWAKAHPTWIAAPSAPTAPPKRPAHRPKGDQEKHLATFRRVLESIEPDDFGRRTYTLDYLSDLMRKVKSPAAPRTCQHYLKILRDRDEIVTAQIGGNGRPYAVLTSCFGGANKSKNAPGSAAKSTADRGANETATERAETPKNDDLRPVCIVDHLNLSVPTAPLSAAAAAPAPAGAQNLGAPPSAPAGALLVADDYPLIDRLEIQVRRDAEALARCWAGKIAGSKRRDPTRQRTVQGEIRRVLGVDQALDQRIDRLASRIDAEFALGRKPIKRAARLARLTAQREADQAARTVQPAPYRERLKMPEAELSDLPRAAPIGASLPSADDLIARLKARKAVQ